jgi:F0F1-type ATP synthase epsilon subunit
MTNNSESKKLLSVSIKSKNKILYEGSVLTLTSKNERGVFDILLLHTNFITLISDYVIIDKGLPSEKRFDFEKGVLYVLSNVVDIYVGI